MHKSKAKNQRTAKAHFPNVAGALRRELFAAMTRGPNESALELDAALSAEFRTQGEGWVGKLAEAMRRRDERRTNKAARAA